MDTGVEDVIAFRRIEWIFVLIWRGGQEARVNPAEYRPLYRDIAEIELIGVERALQSFSPSRPGIDTSPIPRLPIINLLDTPNLLAPFEPLRFLIIQSRLTPPRPHRFEFYVSLTLEKAVWEAVPRSAHSRANVIDKKIRGDVRRSMVNNRL